MSGLEEVVVSARKRDETTQDVPVAVDGVYYGQGRIINEGLFDLSRLEILKGPQALFYGKNATAGVISIIAADPGSASRRPPAEWSTRIAPGFRIPKVSMLAKIH